MRVASSIALLGALAPLVAAQNVTETVVELLGAFQELGLNALIQVAGSIENTTRGVEFLTELTNGSRILFAPTDDALSVIPPSFISDPDVINTILSYHGVFGDFAGVNTTFPNVTIGRTALNNESGDVFLEGGLNQVLAWTTESGKTTVLNQNATVVNSTTVGNITLLVIDKVLTPPSNFSTTVNTTSDLVGLGDALQVVGLTDVLDTVHGFTLFAPSTAAFDAVLTLLTSTASSDPAAIETIFLGHILNSTTVYSPTLVSAASSNQSLISATGEALTFTSNSSGTFIHSGASSAKIVQSDVLLSNGVIHIIDTVLLNNASDPTAASSAFSSATSVAATAAVVTPTGPVGVSGGASGTGAAPSGSQTPGGGSGGGSGSGAVNVKASVALTVSALGLVMGAVFML